MYSPDLTWLVSTMISFTASWTDCKVTLVVTSVWDRGGISWNPWANTRRHRIYPQRDIVITGCPSILSSPKVPDTPVLFQPIGSEHATSTYSDTNAVVYTQRPFIKNGSHVSPSLRMGILLAAQSWRIDGLKLTFGNWSNRSLGTKVSSQPTS